MKRVFMPLFKGGILQLKRKENRFGILKFLYISTIKSVVNEEHELFFDQLS